MQTFHRSPHLRGATASATASVTASATAAATAAIAAVVPARRLAGEGATGAGGLLLGHGARDAGGAVCLGGGPVPPVAAIFLPLRKF